MRIILSLVFIICLIQLSYTDIPRACSTPETSKYPFCDSKLPLEDRIKDLISRINDDEKPLLLTARASPKGNIPRIGLPEYDWGANCVHGVQSRCGKHCPTSFPNPNALGATFNMDLVKQMGAVIGIELRALWLEGQGELGNGIHVGLDCWSPNININRDPRWGRNQEVPGEDPFLSGRFGVAYTTGLQVGNLDPRYLQAVVTLKHWDAYSLENIPGTSIDRGNFDAIVSNYDFANTYFPAFRASVLEGKAKGVMCAYNSVNGIPACASQLLNETLRGRWKFDGYVTSDSGAISFMVNKHKYVKTYEEAAAISIKAGTDINSGGVYSGHLLNATAQGLIKSSDINLALYHTLKLRFQLGLFDPIDDQPYWHVSPDAVNTPQSQALNLQMTKEAMVLLKNNKNTLPLPKGKKIAVIGPHGNATEAMIGNYLGQICPGGLHDYSCVVSPFQSIRALNVGGTTTYAQGSEISGSNTKGFPEAITLAKEADYVVMMVGIDQSQEGEGHDRVNISLPYIQDQFTRSILALGKPTVVVLLNGGAVAVEYLKENADAIVEAFYPGFQGGSAIASVLFGEYNPGGKMPYTVYASDYIKQVNVSSMDMTKAPGRTYRYFTGTPLWTFGYGLSYTQFKFSSSTAANQTISNLSSQKVNFVVNITNSGKVAGDEVVQAYFTPSFDTKIKKQLWDFRRINIAAGKTEQVVFTADYTNFVIGDALGDIVSTAGEYIITITNGVDQKFVTKLTIKGQTKTLEKFPY